MLGSAALLLLAAPTSAPQAQQPPPPMISLSDSAVIQAAAWLDAGGTRTIALSSRKGIITAVTIDNCHFVRSATAPTIELAITLAVCRAELVDDEYECIVARGTYALWPPLQPRKLSWEKDGPGAPVDPQPPAQSPKPATTQPESSIKSVTTPGAAKVVAPATKPASR